MHILEQKKRAHIAGYVISMWHIEDLVRAQNFDVEKVLAILIPPNAPEEEKNLAKEVYGGLVKRMSEQSLKTKGHLEEVNDAIAELQFLHDSLVGANQDEDYLAIYKKAKDGIADLQQLARAKGTTEILACFNGIYGILLLKARQQEVSKETAEAEKNIRSLLDALSDRYKAIRSFPDPSLN